MAPIEPDFTTAKASVAKFRTASPNIAAAFDATFAATTAAFDALQAVAPAPAPTPTPTPTPTPAPPPTTDPAAAAFQALWDTTNAPAGAWSSPIVATTQQALDAALASARAGTRIQARGFTYQGRLAIPHGLVGPVWLDADPTLQIVGPAGVYGQGIWTVGARSLYITGFPRVHGCGNEGLLDQSSVGCYYELDIRDCGGCGVLANMVTGFAAPSGNVYKLTGGHNGIDLSMDPHAQKGTGFHFFNAWQLAGGKILLDIDDQPYGAALESCALNAVGIGIRAKSLSCDVNALPPAPDGSRQIGGNAWQPWDGGAPGPHVNCTVEAISVGSCAQGVNGALSGSGNKGNVVKVGRVGTHRLTPVWPSLPGVTYGDVAPTP